MKQCMDTEVQGVVAGGEQAQGPRAVNQEAD